VDFPAFLGQVVKLSASAVNTGEKATFILCWITPVFTAAFQPMLTLESSLAARRLAFNIFLTLYFLSQAVLGASVGYVDHPALTA
jgi:hypothetical protein